MLDYLGYQPELYNCLICSSTEDTSFAFSPEFGGVICEHHPNAVLKLEKDSLLAMRYIKNADVKNLFSFYISDEACSNLNIISDNFILSQLGAHIKPFDKFDIF